jgi:hypothetical protein
MKVEQATVKLQHILSQPDPQKMEFCIMAMARKGEVDEALYLLTQANLQQAQEAGATAATQILSRLLKRINLENDRSVSADRRLLRSLVRTDSSDFRKQLIYDAFKPKQHVNFNDGTLVRYLTR